MLTAAPGDGVVRCGVLGSPIAHSLSPVLHQAAYRELGLDWVYTAHEVAEAQLGDFLASLDGQWRGLSLTMPLKRAVIDLCDRVEGRGRLLQSINTVVFGPDGSSGYNTDVVGFRAALGAGGIDRLGRVLVVGAGATAASALAAVCDLGAKHVTVLARTPARAQWLIALGSELGTDVRVDSLTTDTVQRAVASGAPDAVVSTIPASGQPPVAAALGAAVPVVFDVIYHPRDTPLVLAAAAAGSTVIGGFELLLHQAARQVELMTGVGAAPLEAMRIAGARVLDNR